MPTTLPDRSWVEINGVRVKRVNGSIDCHHCAFQNDSPRCVAVAHAFASLGCIHEGIACFLTEEDIPAYVARTLVDQ